MMAPIAMLALVTENLPTAARRRFGREPFSARAHTAVHRLTEAA